MIILKIGGSILTKKDSIKPEVDYDNLNRIAGEIEESLKKENITPDLEDGLILIHGAGSFGHPPAEKYKINEGVTEEDYKFKRLGFAEIQNQVKKLNSIVSDVLIEHNIPVISIPPSAFITTSNKRVFDFNLNLLKEYIKEGYVPILYGDIVLDKILKMAIISGDQLVNHISKILQLDSIILGTDVDGVYNKNPKEYPDANLIKVLNNINQIESSNINNIDVTGGMLGKVKELLNLTDLGIESAIINANKPGLISDVLQSREFEGTIIKK